MDLPTTATLITNLDDHGVCHVTFNRPRQRNAMNSELLDGLLAALKFAQEERQCRAVVMRGSGGVFCAGADLKEMSRHSRAEGPDAEACMASFNRRFGAISEAANALDVPVIAVVEGVAMGGGFGLACVADITLAHAQAIFALPETRLGILPAQIAPFVMQRIGAMATRRLALTGARMQAHAALALGLVDGLFEDLQALEQGLADVLDDIHQCAPEASRATKRLLRQLSGTVDPQTLDHGAREFCSRRRSAEGREGAAAFAEKRPPSWAH